MMKKIIRVFLTLLRYEIYTISAINNGSGENKIYKTLSRNELSALNDAADNYSLHTVSNYTFEITSIEKL